MRNCPSCGVQNSDFNAKCEACKRDLPPVPDRAPSTVPNDFLVQAILVTICCCLPFGIVGIVYAAQARSYQSMGDYGNAGSASENAKLWTYLGFWIGLVLGILGLLGSLAGH